MTYLHYFPPRATLETREALERLVNALSAPEDTGALTAIVQDLLDNHEAAAYLLERMLRQDARTIHCD